VALVGVGLPVILAIVVREAAQPATIPVPPPPHTRRLVKTADVSGRHVVMTLAAHIDPSVCKVAWQHAPYAASRGDFDLETRAAVVGTTADRRTLKALVLCRNREANLYEFANAPNEITVSPRLLPTLEFRGVVTGMDDAARRASLDVQVNYYPWWFCSFFGIADCGMSGELVSSVPLKKDGSFSVALPDYLHQREVRGSRGRGEFEFVVRNRDDDQLLYRLSSGTSSGRVHEQTWYWGNQQFRASRVR